MNIATAALPSDNHQPVVSVQPPVINPTPLRRYVPDSEMFRLKGGFEAELIQDPGTRFAASGNLLQAEHELTQVVLKAFEKQPSQAEQYAPRAAMAKNVFHTDWLVVVRKNSQVVAISSATAISDYLIYLNSAMVDPVYQTTGIGLIASALLWKNAITAAIASGKGTPDLVCRTHNRCVASVMLGVFKETGRLSTEPNALGYSKLVMARIVNYLGCEYDEATGISRNVYPEGLPHGHKDNDPRIQAAFAQVGPCDALYVMGQANMHFISRLVEKSLVAREKSFEYLYEMHIKN